MAENRRIRCRTLSGKPLSDSDTQKIMNAIRLNEIRNQSKTDRKICIVVQKPGVRARPGDPVRRSDK